MYVKTAKLQFSRAVAIFSGGLLLYALLYPSIGIGTIDTRLYGIIGNQLIFFQLTLTLLLIQFLLFLRLIQYICSSDLLLLSLICILSFIVLIESVYHFSIGYSILRLNIYSISLIYQLIVWLKLKRNSMRFYPIILYGVFFWYALNILIILCIPVEYQPREVFYFHGVRRLSLIFDNPNHLGSLLAFGVVYCFGTVVLTRRRWAKLTLWSLLAVLVLGLIQTYSRGAWLGAVVGITAAVAYLWARAPLKRLVSGLALLLLITMFSFAITPGGYPYIFHRTTRINPSADASVGNRIEIWKSAVKMTRDHWLTGVGIGQFENVLEKGYKPAALAKQHYASAMNNYLTLAAEAGIPTALLYLFCLGFACVLASRRLPREGFAAGSSIGMLCGVYSMLVFACTTYTLGRVYAIVLVWSVLGYLVAAPLQDKPEMQCVRQNTES